MKLRRNATRSTAVFLCLTIFMSGCASAGIKHEATSAAEPAGAAARPNPVYTDSGAIVVRAKRLTKLERRRMEAVRENSRDTAAVILAAAAAVTAYTGMEIYYAARNEKQNALITFSVVAAAAYFVSITSGFIIDMFTR